MWMNKIGKKLTNYGNINISKYYKVFYKNIINKKFVIKLTTSKISYKTKL
jgi:hypothetical protein